MKILFRDPGFVVADLIAYVENNIAPPADVLELEGAPVAQPMWRGVADKRFTSNRLTSWASTRQQAELFLHTGPREFQEVKYRETAKVVAMVLHEDAWVEYVVVD